jgi:RHS repeat-associated protein
VIAEYSYDPLGRRYKKVTQSETLYFYYADEGLVGEFDATGTSVRQYGYVPDSMWTTDPLYQKTSQGYAYYQNDHLGMSRGLIRKNGSKVWKGEYRAFGGLKSESGAWENRLRFPGQYFDEETNNYYNYFRDYDPTTGRYKQSDPIGLEGGFNTYAYVGANPLNRKDFLGLASEECNECDTKNPDEKKLCSEQCNDLGACADCCTQKHRNICEKNGLFSKECRNSTMRDKTWCISYCSGAPRIPKVGY